jgi:uncharacterized membrane protein
LHRAHVTGPHRTLTQDLAFAIDQLVEIAIRALSPAVNDTFTALTCIDWLGDGLCDIYARPVPSNAHRDADGRIRLIDAGISYGRLVDRAFDKIRQAGRGMPAVMMRQLESLTRIAQFAQSADQHPVLQKQADAISRSSEEAIADARDREDVRRRYDAFLVIGEAGA